MLAWLTVYIQWHQKQHKMKIIYNNIIPFKGFKAMNLFGVLFVRNDIKTPMSDIDINHESIHSEQYKELLWIPFLILYGLEWFIKLFYYFDSHKAYRNISFEREAYNNEKDLTYLENRKRYNWLKLIFN